MTTPGMAGKLLPSNSARLMIHVLGFVSLVCYALMIFWNQQSQLDLTWFYLLLMLVFGLWGLLARLTKTELEDHWPIILFWAVAFRLASYGTLPIFEDDIYRYLWDGYVFFTTGNPYGVPPSDYFYENLDQIHSAILDGIAYPEVPTIYGPVSELIFLASYSVAPMEIWPLRSFVLIADMSLLFSLRLVAPVRGVVLYAWCPLIIHSFAFNLHSDVFAVAFVALALVFYQKQTLKVAMFLALAVASKVFALLLVPFLIGRNWRAWIVFASILGIIYMPFILQGATEWQGLNAMNQHWQFNASVFALIASVVGFNMAKILTMGLFLCFYAIGLLLFRSRPGLPRGDIIFGLFFLLSAVVNPWYWIWVLVFAAFHPGLWAWFCSAALMLGYASGINLPGWDLALYQQPAWVLVLEYSSIILAVLMSYMLSRRATNQTAGNR